MAVRQLASIILVPFIYTNITEQFSHNVYINCGSMNQGVQLNEHENMNFCTYNTTLF
jgi:hypothetical protein